MDCVRKSDVQLSKTLSWLLRHGAIKEGLPIGADGFIPLESVLSHRALNGHFTIADVMRVVESDSKNRYAVVNCPNTNKILLRANQGHSIQEVNELKLTKILCASEIPLLVHGTFYKHLSTIQVEGLKRMNRNHIHFAVSDKPQSGKDRVSGIRHNCEILVYVNSELAMSKGIEFFRSENNVILSPGLNGVISTEFFTKIVKRSGKILKATNSEHNP